ncbi:NF-kappa-B-activating protein [Gracilaria domingensis]|nr:NF-kappa-B-activating protein [Gracilaria domingensis]
MPRERNERWRQNSPSWSLRERSASPTPPPDDDYYRRRYQRARRRSPSLTPPPPKRARRNGTRSSARRDRTWSPVHRARTRSPAPAREERTRSPVYRERRRSPARLDPARSPARRDRTRSPARRNRPRSPVFRDRTRSPARRTRGFSPVRQRSSLSPGRGRRSPSPHRRHPAPSPVRRSRSATPPRYGQRQSLQIRRRSPLARAPQREYGGGARGYWARRVAQREEAVHVTVWERSPSPPARLENRFDVGADLRAKRERKRKRKEEKRRRRAERAKQQQQQEPEDKKDDEEKSQSQPKALKGKRDSDEDIDDAPLGPAPPTKEKRDFGKALLKGEGSKMAAFIQEGVRIPRRGEIGLTGEQISSFEKQGYVMSGSRNRRMEAVRIRKENQVYSAEERAALNDLDRDEKKRREEMLLKQYRELVESKLGADDEHGE